MSKLTDCPSCGGLLPVGRSCCPHCHCKYSRATRWKLVAAAAMGLGAASCDSNGLLPTDQGGHADLSGHPDLSAPDLSMPPFAIEYGPAMPLDFSTPTDGGTD